MDVIRLVRESKKGSKEALLQLVMNEKDDYYRLAYTYMGNEHDAMDAMEEMIVKVFEKINQLKKEEAFYSWSKTILVNTCKTLLRKQKKVVFVDDWSYGEHPEPVTSDPYLKSERKMDIQQMLKQLNEDQREAIQLKYFYGLDYQSIATLTNVSIGTVKSRVFQGLKKLKDHFGGADDE